MLKGV